MAIYMHYANVTFLSQEFIYTAIAKRYQYYFSNAIACLHLILLETNFRRVILKVLGSWLASVKRKNPRK